MKIPDSKRRRLRASYSRLFDSPDGIIVDRDLYQMCFMDRSTTVRGDPIASAYNEGMRAVYLWIFKMSGAEPRRLRELEEMEDE